MSLRIHINKLTNFIITNSAETHILNLIQSVVFMPATITASHSGGLSPQFYRDEMKIIHGLYSYSQSEIWYATTFYTLAVF